MKTAILILTVLIALLGAPRLASASGGYMRQLNCEWRRAYPEIQADIDYSNWLIGLDCDSARHAAVMHRFRQLDHQSLYLYNRGVLPASTSTSVPSRPR
jgi:hypothetical protein